MRNSVELPVVPSRTIADPLVEPEAQAPSGKNANSDDNVVQVEEQIQPEVMQVPVQVDNERVVPLPAHIMTPSPDQSDKNVVDMNQNTGEHVTRRSQRVRKPNSSLDPAVWDLGQVEINGDTFASILLHQNEKLLNLLAIQVTGQHRGGGDN